MKKQALLLLSLIFGLHVISLGQDIHLSQYYMQDQLLNPGAVGNFIGDFRVAGSYREQWKQISAGKDPISSYMLGYEMPVNVRSQKLDLGIIVTQDNMADLDIASNKILFSTAYKLSLGASDVRVGIQFGPILRRSSFDSYSYPSQWAYYPNAFDTENRSSGETSLNNSSGYFDVNAGAVWLKQYSRMHIEGGMALNHVNRPKDTHFDGFTERLRMRKTAHLFVNYRLTPNLYIEPKAMLTWTANANELLLGGNVKLKSPLDFIPWIYFGTYYRHGIKRNFDAIYPVFGLTYGSFDIGFSYDYNVSDLSGVDSRKGAFEIAIIYVAKSTKNEVVVLPCERF